VLQQAVDAKEVPGVVAVAATDQGLLYEGAFGRRAHPAGFSYEMWDENTVRYVKVSGMPSTITGKIDAIRMPLAFDPGDKWEYGVNTDWVGRLVEAMSGQTLDVYLREKIFAPLGMKDTGYVASDEQRTRQAVLHLRQADGTLAAQPMAG
jgi:CubicO group peptidase (beta-lactamase class C family)